MNLCQEYYFDWLVGKVCNKNNKTEYSNLLNLLYTTDYIWNIELDENCAIYGLELRKRFADESVVGRKMYRAGDYISEECSMLELLVSMSLKMEEEIMQNDDFGNRTSLWFWKMIDNLGLKKYSNYHWNREKVYRIIDIFMKNDYSEDGKGGLFLIKNCKFDMRTLPIWRQCGLFLSKISMENGEIY